MPRADSVLIVEDDLDIADLCTGLLEREGLSARAFASAESFLEHADLERAACLIVDMYLPGMTGLQLLQHLLTGGSRVPVIFMSGQARVRDAIAALDGGAHRVFEKPVEAETLVEAVRQAIAGYAHWQRVVAEQQQRFGSLTPRELEILTLLVHDQSIKQIANALGISSSTVEKHRAKIFAKTGAHSVVGLARMYLTGCQEALPGAPPAGTCSLKRKLDWQSRATA